MKQKIVTADQLAQVAHKMRAENRRLVFTNGCFDLLHVGHVLYLDAARELGDALAVGINGDDSVRALKGPGRPINSESDRATILAALAAVDYVVIFQEVRATALLEKIRPAIYAKGGDYRPDTLNAEERRTLENCGAEIRILPLQSGYSTSRVIARMQRDSCE